LAASLLFVLLLAGLHLVASADPGQGEAGLSGLQAAGLQLVVRYPLKQDISPALRTISPVGPAAEKSPAGGKPYPYLVAGAETASLQRLSPRRELPPNEPLDRPDRGQDPVLQSGPDLRHPALLAMPDPIQNFDGLDSNDNLAVVGFRIMPPDTQGDVGPDHYIQWVNLVFAVWNKSGELLYGPAAGRTLWSGFGGACENTNDGDPITLYDAAANRWLMSQFALPNYPNGPFYQCVAVSRSGDPTGAWNRYEYEWQDGLGRDVMNDYPKFGIWPDGYYMSADQYVGGNLGWAGVGVAAFERVKMLQGEAARMIYIEPGLTGWGGLLPADMDGLNPPPAGAPNYFVGPYADEWPEGAAVSANAAVRLPDGDQLTVWAFHADWAAPERSSFTPAVTLEVAPFDGGLCDLSQDCIPQPDTRQKLDAIADHLMHRLQYRNFGSHETLVANLTVDADGSNHAGVRWFELRRVEGAWSVHQQGTYAPDADHRWMGSIAMDGMGNIALGYSIAGGDTYPSVRYAGRLVTDPIGTLPRAEVELIAGSSFHAGGNRWGDYSMLAVDPVDDCTFWYTQEYVSAPGSWGNWSTRIGSFRFADCGGQAAHVEGVVTDEGGTPLIGAQVTAAAAQAYTTYSRSPDGYYHFEALPAGTYTLTAQAYGYRPQIASAVQVTPLRPARIDFRLQPAPRTVVSGRVTDALTGWPLYASLQIVGYAGGEKPIWSDPVTGYYSVTLSAEVTHTFHVAAWGGGYVATERVVYTQPGPQVAEFALAPDLESCSATGYGAAAVGVRETFQASASLPPGWTVVDHLDSGQVWRFDDPGQRGNRTGGAGRFAIVDSDYYGDGGHQDTDLRTPLLDFSRLATVSLQFDTDYRTFERQDTADVDLSVDGGTTWTNVWRRAGGNYFGPSHEVVDLSALAGGQADVMVRFHYYDALWEYWWQVDNVLVGQDQGCQPGAGSLVSGYVADQNTGEPLVGATVTGDQGSAAFTVATPLDPSVGDGFYLLFTPAGTRTLTATLAGGWGPGTATIAVPVGQAIRQDLYLPSGRLAYAPDGIELTLKVGVTATLPVSLSNIGSQELAFEIAELEVGFQPAGGTPDVEVTIPAADFRRDPNARMAKRFAAHRPEVTFLISGRDRVWRPSGLARVLLLTPDAAAGGDITLLQNTLAAFPDLEVALWDITHGPPSGSDLAGYDLVIVGNDIRWSAVPPGISPAAIGDALADYIDAGGRVIDTLFAHDHAGWQLAGRYVDGGYAPFTPSTTSITSGPYYLGMVYDATHPILAGVVAVQDHPSTGICHQDVGVARDATRLADWNDGQVLIAYNEKVVGVNQLWFHGASWSGDLPRLMHNAILYLLRGDVDWLAVDPVGGALAPDEEQAVAVFLDAGAPAATRPGQYLAKLYLRNDTPYGNPAIPITLTVVSNQAYLPLISRQE